jgi:hypothetical protein
MADPISFLREKMRSLAGRRQQESDAQAQRSLSATSFTPENALGGNSSVPQLGQNYTTGYNGTETTIPFMRGVSVWGDGDIWTE